MLSVVGAGSWDRGSRVVEWGAVALSQRGGIRDGEWSVVELLSGVW